MTCGGHVALWPLLFAFGPRRGNKIIPGMMLQQQLASCQLAEASTRRGARAEFVGPRHHPSSADRAVRRQPATIRCAAVPQDLYGWSDDRSRASTQELLALLRERPADHESPGEVHLVGTGPGDPELLTLKAVRLLQTAEVVLYDRLVSEEILQLISPSACMIYVGKEQGFHTRTQTEIHELLCQFAQSCSTVVRLKGGDPYIFGRGGEEMEYLQQRGIAVHCVPGISAATGISAELGIPLTHRGLATGVQFVTGHLKEDAATCFTSYPNTTLVVYMGLGTLPSWSASVQQRGLGPDTPAVAIERGTTDQQRAVYAPVQSLPQLVAQHGLESPALIIVGPVVALSPGWQACQASGSSLREGRWVASGSSPSPSSSQACDVLRLAASVGADARSRARHGDRQL